MVGYRSGGTAARRTFGYSRPAPVGVLNELAGGSGNAYPRFADEGVDMGQRSADVIRYYREHLEATADIPYSFYPLSRSEMQRRRVRVSCVGHVGRRGQLRTTAGNARRNRRIFRQCCQNDARS